MTATLIVATLATVVVGAAIGYYGCMLIAQKSR